MPRQSPVSTSRGLDSQSDDEDEQDNTLTYEIFGKFRTKVVGVRYYTGYANKNEMIKLIREPSNAYDRWAIRVDNQQNQQIGHIGRDQACHLAPLIDSNQLGIEGFVQGEKGVYSMPIDIVCFGPPSAKSAVINRLRMGGMQLQADPEDFMAGGRTGVGQQGTTMLSAVQMEERLERMFDEFMETSSPQQLMDPNSEVRSQLFLHQKAALAWMLQRENSCQLPPFWQVQCKKGKQEGQQPVYVNTLTNFMSGTRPAPLRGGLLADDMGLGKTLVVISLVASNRPGVPPPAAYTAPPVSDELDEPEEQKKKKKKRQAKDKEQSAQPAKRQKQGPKAAPSLTKSVLSQAEVRRQQLEASLEPLPSPPAANGPRTTLIVCPLSVMSNWVSQFEEHTAGTLKVYVYHGPCRNSKASFLSSQDVVITTYSTLAQDLPASGGQAKVGLLALQWLRLVLDEAHNVKNVNALQSRAAAAVQADRRWAVTGTPIQNKLDDLFGLLTFLRLEPLNQRHYFTRTIARPIKANDARGLMKLQVLMHAVALRRTKTMQVNGRPLVLLPRRTVNLVQVQLQAGDRQKYDRLELEGRRIISQHLQQQTLLDNYMSVLEIILRLRQVCDSAALVPEDRLKLRDPASPRGKAKGQQLDKAELQRLLVLLAEGGGDDCSICLEPFSQPCITMCGHIYCRPCIQSVITLQKAACPLCRRQISVADLLDAPAPAEAEAADQAAAAAAAAAVAAAGGGAGGAKVTALISRLLANRQAATQGSSKDAGEPIKSVVFSQFLGMIALVQSALTTAGISFRRIDGSTPAKAREEILRDFSGRSASCPEVLLVSLKAGGVGINLTAACQVHLLDPWWNPAVEEQAMDRVHRLGQTRDVEVLRYIARDTIEERMLELQERKRHLAGAAFQRRRPDDSRQMRVDDVKLLMRL